jgi:predicted Zn-dependent protease
VTGFDAVYFDGKTSSSIPVRCEAVGTDLRIEGPGVLRVVPLAEISPQAPIGNAPRILPLQDGAQLRTADAGAVDALFPRSTPLESAVHGLEQHWPAVVAAVAAVAVFTWWAAVYGLPAGASLAASFVPRDLEAELGRRTFASIDGKLCDPSRLDAARQDALQKRFMALAAGRDDGYAYQLHLRSCRGIGPNAFALPGGVVVMTDALVELASHDDQLSAVFAHEIGHVRHRHGLRLSLQAAGAAALTAALFGDAVSIAGLAASLPTVLLQTGYSRGLESEADEYAFARLKEAGLSPAAFADIMERLDGRSTDAKDDGEDAGYFATHPATAKRIERAREAAR